MSDQPDTETEADVVQPEPVVSERTVALRHPPSGRTMRATRTAFEVAHRAAGWELAHPEQAPGP